MVTRRTITFESQGRDCVGDLYLPSGFGSNGGSGTAESATDPSEPPPVVVMGNGLGGTRDLLLPRVGRAFAARGLAAFAFDYRGFGDSAGPRQRIDPFMHVEDWIAAVDAMASIPAVDGSRVALWGTSFGGGHAIETAARRDVDAVAVCVPYVDGIATLRHVLGQSGWRYALAAGGHALKDQLSRLLGRDPHFVQIVGPPGEFAIANVPGAEDGYLDLLDDEDDWTNECQASLVVQIPRYRPIGRAQKVTCPTLVAIATNDRLVPASAAERLVDRLPAGRALRFACGHFDIYDDERFGLILEATVERFESAFTADVRSDPP